MNKEEFEYIKNLTINADETVHFLSNDMKSERERCACAAFLRCLGVDFLVEDLVSVKKGNDPPDVIFHAAHFEVLEVLDEGRKRHHESKTRAECLKKAKTIEDTLVQSRLRDPLSYAEVFNLITGALAEKSSRYGVKVCAGLDALICIQLQHKFLTPKSPLPSHATLLDQGWRSVSFVMVPYSHVIYAAELAPDFLRVHRGQTRQEWNDSDTFFKL